ncbi:hypothetical protein [Ferrimonas marina]|uniref:Uncharacterized protein n=1 Tax=Ferrimonas marina TaxID=299255 RepID=A0A1M5NU78_9GAMM|nr:hypothetical protein [Ferrimonas marina]SHG93037.1 hypothetical protein SAMN02745129_1179 [Ferrimonas marina]
MKKRFEFAVGIHQITIINSWFRGVKLFVDGELIDSDNTLLAREGRTLLSARLGELGTLEVKPLSALVSVEMDAYLNDGKQLHHIYSSHQCIDNKPRTERSRMTF